MASIMGSRLPKGKSVMVSKFVPANGTARKQVKDDSAKGGSELLIPAKVEIMAAPARDAWADPVTQIRHQA